MSRVLVVDDDSLLLRSLAESLTTDGWAVSCAATGREAMSKLGESHHSVVCIDAVLDGESGVDLLCQVRERFPDSQRLLMTGMPTTDLLTRAVNQAEVFRVLFKPFSAAIMRDAVREAHERYAAMLIEARRQTASEEERVHLRTVKEELEGLVQQRTHLLSKAKREWEATFDAIASPIAIVAPDYKIIRANIAVARQGQVDIKEVTGRRCHDVLFGRQEACEGCPVGQVFAGADSAEAEVTKDDGRVFQVSAFKKPQDDAAVCSYQDITARRQAAKAAFHTDKMVALGQLAGGVAHEINNPIASILAFSTLLKGEPGRSDEDAEAIDAIEQSALRCKRIVESMLRFSRRDTKRTDLDVSAVLREAVALFQMHLKQFPKVKLEVALPDGLPSVHANSGQLEQVAMNLMQNGLHAIPTRQGQLTVSAAQEGDMVVFRITDSGTGIKPEHLAQIFEPTFTTKAAGEGTGFGLAITDSIIREHGGRVEVSTELGKGTTFSIFLPSLRHPGES